MPGFSAREMIARFLARPGVKHGGNTDLLFEWVDPADTHIGVHGTPYDKIRP